MTPDVLVSVPSWFGGRRADEVVADVIGDPRVACVAPMTNNPEFPQPEATAPVWSSYPHLTLYGMWNIAGLQALQLGLHLVLLNDDIVPGRRLVSALVGQLDAHPEYALVSVDGHEEEPRRGEVTVREVYGSRRTGGISGWAFAVRAGCWPAEGIDPHYRIWYGDDDLCWKLRDAGHRLGVAEGLSVGHATSSTVNAVPWGPEAIAEDVGRWTKTGRP